eukprot:scaffold115804_cov26-Tisochrysis_lutea.AAC.1
MACVRILWYGAQAHTCAFVIPQIPFSAWAHWCVQGAWHLSSVICHPSSVTALPWYGAAVALCRIAAEF